WGEDASLPFLMAYQQGKLLPLENLNDGFVRPKFSEQVIFSYFQASLICELVERDFGFPAILAMLKSYHEGSSTEEVFHDVLHTDLPGFDNRLDRYIRERYVRPLASIRPHSLPKPGERHDTGAIVQRAAADTSDFIAQVAAGAALTEANRGDEAIPY